MTNKFIFIIHHFTILQTAESILKFDFNKKRVKILTKLDEVAPKSKGVVYWMFRDARVEGKYIVKIIIKFTM